MKEDGPLQMVECKTGQQLVANVVEQCGLKFGRRKADLGLLGHQLWLKQLDY
ncbi:hypothetical protein RvY_09567 [Ramazzottius varieornatus]|uniref:Uncharacterized protein n=1 Tax=Ramazzottius varieornatus TaxID=947166 RepID=A0A1D1VC72_RAMVA|nr:hypothetical protein RvY_09567 [Ramazzottius varieornatus]